MKHSAGDPFLLDSVEGYPKRRGWRNCRFRTKRLVALQELAVAAAAIELLSRGQAVAVVAEHGLVGRLG